MRGGGFGKSSDTTCFCLRLEFGLFFCFSGASGWRVGRSGDSNEADAEMRWMTVMMVRFKAAVGECRVD